MDYLRKPKAGYYALKRAYQPILPSIEPVTDVWRQGREATVRLWAINDTWSACEECRLTWQVKQSGKRLAEGETIMTLPPDSGTRVKEITVTPTSVERVTIEYRIENNARETVGKNRREESVEASPAGK